jgi:hypothetical protein
MKLGSGFARGWKKLTNELKGLEGCIFEYLLIYKLIGPACSVNFTATFDINKASMENLILRYYRVTPDTPILARGIFYKKSTFYLDPEEKRRGWQHFLYPPPQVNAVSRHIEYHMTLKQSDWNFTQRLASWIGMLSAIPVRPFCAPIGTYSSMSFATAQRATRQLYDVWLQINLVYNLGIVLISQR